MDATTLTRAAARDGSSAAALMPTGKPSDAPEPEQGGADHGAPRRLPPKETSSSPVSATPISAAQHRHPAVPVEQRRAEPSSGRHGGQEDRQGQGAERRRHVVAVDDRDAEPVVAGALGEGGGEHEQRRSAGFAARSRPAAGAARRVPPRGSGGWYGQELPRRPAGHDDHDAPATTSRWTVTGTCSGDRDRADQGARHGSEAPAGVEARHDRAPEELLDGSALDVHRRRPRCRCRSRTETAPRRPGTTLKCWPMATVARAAGKDERHDRDGARPRRTW